MYTNIYCIFYDYMQVYQGSWKKKVEHVRKKVKCENQCHARAKNLDLMNFIVHSTIAMNPITTLLFYARLDQYDL
jgi:hypothetical protein